MIGALALCLVVTLNILNPAHKGTVLALAQSILAKVHILAVVAHHHGSHSIIMQLHCQAGSEVGRRDAVDCSDWVAVPLLRDAFGGGEVEESEKRPQIAGVRTDECHFVGGFVAQDGI